MPQFTGGLSPANIAHFLGGIKFPCSKTDLINHATNKGAPDDVVNVLEAIPDTIYNSMTDVMSGVGEVE